MRNWKTKNGYRLFQVLSGRSNSYLISSENLNILVDTGKVSAYPRLKRNMDSLKLSNQEISFLILSHTHFDHFMDVPAIAKKTGARVYGSPNTCMLSRQLDVPTEQLQCVSAKDAFQAGSFSVQSIMGRHPWIPGYGYGKLRHDLEEPLRLRDYRMDSNLSFRVKVGNISILIWNSTRTEGAMPADTLICRAVSNDKWYKHLMDAVRPRLVLPAHWDNFFVPLDQPLQPFFAPPRLSLPPVQRIDLQDFRRKVKAAAPACKVAIPERFQEIQI